MTAGSRKPNAIHARDGTGRADRGTDLLVVLPDELSADPPQFNFKTFDRDEVFNMLRDWVIAATGSAVVDTVLLTMMVDLLEDYAAAETAKERGPILDRYHKLAREFGMTPQTREHMVKAAVKVDDSRAESILNGP